MKKYIAAILTVAMLFSALVVPAEAEGVSFKRADVLSASSELAAYAEQNRCLPEAADIGGTSVKLSEYVYIASKTLVNIKNNITASVPYKSIASSAKIVDDLTEGDITRDQIINIAVRLASATESTFRLPNYVSSPLGKLGANNYIYLLAKTLGYYADNAQFPISIHMQKWSDFVMLPSVTPTPVPTAELTALPTADPTPTPYPITITYAAALNAVFRTNTYIQKNKKLPLTVTIGTYRVQIPQILGLAAILVKNLSVNDKTSDISMLYAEYPEKPAEDIASGSLNKEEYLSIADGIISFIKGISLAPSYAKSTLGDISYQTLMSTYTNIIAYYIENKKLPDSVKVSSWSDFSGQILPTPGITLAPITTPISTAAQPTPTPAPVEIRIQDILTASSAMQTYIENNKALPPSIIVGGNTATMPQYLNLAVKAIKKISAKDFTDITLKAIAAPSASIDNLTAGELSYSVCLNFASRLSTYFDANAKAPNYFSIALGRVGFENSVYLFARMLATFNEFGVLVNSMKIEPWTDFIAPTPSLEPTQEPTLAPTLEPTLAPTLEPTLEPTLAPTLEPTQEPTLAPTLEPTLEPTQEPTLEPTLAPTPTQPAVYTIYFDANGGICTTASKTVTNGEAIGTLPVPVRDGFNFNGWYTENSGGENVTASMIAELSSDKTLYAQWSFASFTVSQIAAASKALFDSYYVTVPSSGQNNYDVPAVITVGSVRVTQAQYFYLTCEAIIKINAGTQTGTAYRAVEQNTGGMENTFTTRKMPKAAYVYAAEMQLEFIIDDGNGKPSNYVTFTNAGYTSTNGSRLRGKHSYEANFMMNIEILRNYALNGVLPATAYSQSFLNIATPSVMPTPPATVEPPVSPAPSETPYTTPGTTLPSGTLSASQIAASMAGINTYYKTNGVLPASYTIGSISMTKASYVKMAAKALIAINGGNTSSGISYAQCQEPSGYTSTFNSTSISKAAYIYAASRVIDFYDANSNVPPNYVSYPNEYTGSEGYSGYLGYDLFSLIFIRVLSYYNENNILPSTVLTTASEPTPTPSDFIGVMPGDDFETGSIGTQGAVSSASAYSSKIGLDILKAGGNAIDAAVATMFAVGLLEPSGSSIGGGGLAVIYLKSENRYIVMDYMSQTPSAGGSTSVLAKKLCIPGMVHGAITMLNDYGTMTLAQVLDPVIELARTGFPVTSEFKYRTTLIDKSYTYPTNLFTKNSDGDPISKGDIFKNEDLADTLEIIRDGGIQAFYNSTLTDTMVNYIQSIGGVIKKSDFQQYTSLVREPLTTTYRGYKVYTGSGTAQGGSRLVSMLNKMSNTVMSNYLRDSAQAVRATAVAFGMTSRGSSLGVKEDVLGILKDTIPYDDKTTTMIVTYDKYGNAVASNVTLGDNFGCCVAVPGTGFCFNSGMGTSSGTSLSRIMSTMCPTIVAGTNGKPMIVLGSPGDQAIITATAITISNIIDYNMNVCEAVNAPRFFGYASSSAMTIETRYSASTLSTLRTWGYTLTTDDEYSKGVGNVPAIHILSDGAINAAADYRREYMSYAY